MTITRYGLANSLTNHSCFVSTLYTYVEAGGSSVNVVAKLQAANPYKCQILLFFCTDWLCKSLSLLCLKHRGRPVGVRSRTLTFSRTDTHLNATILPMRDFFLDFLTLKNGIDRSSRNVGNKVRSQKNADLMYIPRFTFLPTVFLRIFSFIFIYLLYIIYLYIS
jgi:hypothetical protein